MRWILIDSLDKARLALEFNKLRHEASSPSSDYDTVSCASRTNAAIEKIKVAREYFINKDNFNTYKDKATVKEVARDTNSTAYVLKPAPSTTADDFKKRVDSLKEPHKVTNQSIEESAPTYTSPNPFAITPKPNKR